MTWDPIVQKVDCARDPLDNAIGFPNSYQLDSNLFIWWIVLSNFWTTGGQFFILLLLLLYYLVLACNLLDIKDLLLNHTWHYRNPFDWKFCHV